MERELRAHLMACAAAFGAAKNFELNTIGRLVMNEWAFFERLSDPTKTFTARTYDRVMAWFSANWPEGTPWPADVPRPELAADEPRAA